MILASLKVHEDKELEDEEKISYIPTHKLQIGDRFDATYVNITYFINLFLQI
jgi:hypothetical protein